LEIFLNVAKEWFSSSYPEGIDKNTWFDVGQSPYKVDFSIIPNMINSNLINPEMSGQLTYLIQLIDRFNQRIDIFNNYAHSNTDLYNKLIEIYKNKNFVGKNYVDCYKEIKNEVISEGFLFYIMECYRLKQIIHTDGIGEMRDFNNSNFPNLNKCFHNVSYLLTIEKKNKKSFLKDDIQFMIGDVVFMLIPAGIILYLILKFLYEIRICKLLINY